ncbi:MAG: hypothetical protein JW958_02185 [Candidatus Eisenbacteria bacterium]|nr:hypothetical protein [Candidatus Eisenbacteria bacterium]
MWRSAKQVGPGQGPLGGPRCLPYLLLAAAFAAGALSARGEETQASIGRMLVPMLSQLTLMGDMSDLLTLTADGVGESAYDAGQVESAADATVLTINANAPWDLSVKLAGDWTCPGAYDKDEDDLAIRITNTPTGTIQNGAGSYIDLDGSDTQILSHTEGVADNAVHVQTRVLLDWAGDIPGTYGITITYTLVAHVE